MDASFSRSQRVSRDWPKKVSVGRVKVTVYRRTRADGKLGYEVANYIGGKRRLESFPDPESGLERAKQIARQLSEGDVIAASMTNEEAANFASAVQALEPFKVSLPAAASTLAECLKLVGDLPSLHDAAKYYATRNKRTTRKSVKDAVEELIAVKAARQASPRYIQTLTSELTRFASTFQKDVGDVRTSEIQAWLDSFQVAKQTYVNRRRVVHLLFEHSVARGYATENPVVGTDNVEVGDRDVEIFTPGELQSLLSAGSPEFLPCLALGAFAGLRTAEIQRLEWEDILHQERTIVVGAKKAKTATRRTVPVSENLAAWLAPYEQLTGLIWSGNTDKFHDAQQEAARASGVKWKANALRHSFASYRFAIIADAGRVAGELGNSATVVHRHYRELVKTKDAERWFSILPEDRDGVIRAPFSAHK